MSKVPRGSISAVAFTPDGLKIVGTVTMGEGADFDGMDLSG